MNKPMLLIGIIIMALMGFFAVNMVTSQQTGSELDYYLLKDTTEAAMNDAIDYDFYSNNGVVRMDKEKFLESFVRRFADSVDGTRDYNIDVYDLNETPPKVSVKIFSKSSSASKNNSTDITTNVDMIIESKNKTDTYTTNFTSRDNNTSSSFKSK
jgi:hypothetical protein